MERLNCMHPNLKFTCELGPKMLPFLDTCIELPQTDKDSFISKVFRKSTYTGLILNFSAVCPPKWKYGLVQCFLHRAYMISSNWSIFSQEIEFLKTVFVKNGYPVDFFYSCVNKFLNNKHDVNSNVKVSEEKVEAMFSIPYIGLPSVIYGRKICKLF